MRLKIIRQGRQFMDIEAVREQALRAAETHMDDDDILQVWYKSDWRDTTLDELRELSIS